MHHYQKKNLLSSVLVIVSFLIAFLIFVERLELHRLRGFDKSIIRVVQGRIDTENTRLMRFFTFLGSPLCVSGFVAISTLLLYRSGRKKDAAGMFLANAIGAGFNEGLKYTFRRRRPDIHRLVSVHGYSFPSGLSMGSMMFYGTVCYFVFKRLKHAALKVFLYFVSGFMVLLTGLSLIYLGVHYPSDVLAGYAAGGAFLSASITGLNAYGESSYRSTSKKM